MTDERYWLTPPEMLERLEAQYGPFDFDPCPSPLPEGWDGLSMDWGSMSYVNPPFRPGDVENSSLPKHRQGPTAFVHKAIEQQKLGRGVVILLPVQSYVMHLAAAGAEIIPMGRVKWLEVDTGEPMKGPSPICAFILRGEKG